MDIHIAICDDEAPERAYLQKLASDWAQCRNLRAGLSAYDSAEAFLFAFAGEESFDILLLDIQMKKLDGITLARKLRETDDRLQIIFITGFADFMAEGYDVSALHYLMKPVGVQKLHAVMDKAYARLHAAVRTVRLPVSEGHIRLRVDEIFYAEVFSHHVELHTASQVIQIKISLSELEQLLGDGFIRCHRSYVAGLRHVRKIERTAIVLDNGVRLPLSRKHYDSVNQAFIRQW